MESGILVVDFGSQNAHLIARRVRDAGVYCACVPCDRFTMATLADHAPRGIIFSGGPASATLAHTPRMPPEIYHAGIPILGICYGQQMMVAQLGGEVEPGEHSEFGRIHVDITADCALFDGVWPQESQAAVWMNHRDRVVRLPAGFSVAAASRTAPFAAIVDESRRFYGVQFHPEVVHTPGGARLIERFVRNICGCPATWSMASYRREMVAELRGRIGEDRVLCALSGGVDSAVTAALVHEAVGDQLVCVFVDHGMMRMGEPETVRRVFGDRFQIPLVCLDAGALFLQRLGETIDPEEKRKIIGATFIEVFEKQAGELGDIPWLAQGTLYPDVVESVSFGGGPSVTIKSHHNVGGLPERMNMKLVEPLRALFKDEVRRLGRELGLPEEMIGRHPFPGPGLAIRIPGQPITAEKLDLLRQVDAVFLDEIRKAGLYQQIWQAFAVLLPVRTVGVMGEERSHDFAVALRAVTAEDGMTADFYPFPIDFLGRVAGRIVNEIRGVNRVTYDITSKPPATIEWE